MPSFKRPQHEDSGVGPWSGSAVLCRSKLQLPSFPQLHAEKVLGPKGDGKQLIAKVIGKPTASRNASLFEHEWSSGWTLLAVSTRSAEAGK